MPLGVGCVWSLVEKKLAQYPNPFEKVQIVLNRLNQNGFKKEIWEFAANSAMAKTRASA